MTQLCIRRCLANPQAVVHLTVQSKGSKLMQRSEMQLAIIRLVLVYTEMRVNLKIIKCSD
jgi:hypothetical protein